MVFCSQLMVVCSLAYGTLLPRPSGCLLPANPGLPRPDLQSLSLRAQPPPEHLKLWLQGGGADYLCSYHSALPSSVKEEGIFLHFEIPPSWLISLSVSWLPRVGVPFLFWGSFSATQECWSYPDSLFFLSLPFFFSFVLTSYVEGFLPFLEV